jgi:hypothetical protein
MGFNANYTLYQSIRKIKGYWFLHILLLLLILYIYITYIIFYDKDGFWGLEKLKCINWLIWWYFQGKPRLLYERL